MKRKETFTSLIILVIIFTVCGLMKAQQLIPEFRQREILFETNNDCQNMISITKKVFVSYILITRKTFTFIISEYF